MTQETPTTKSARFFSGGATRTIIYLTVASLMVGFVLATIGLNPVDFWEGLMRGVSHLAQSIIDLGWGAVYTIGQYIVLGAVIVVPIWLLLQLINRTGRR